MKVNVELYLKHGKVGATAGYYLLQINTQGHMQAFRKVGDNLQPIFIRPLPPKLMAVEEIDVEYAVISDHIIMRAGGTEVGVTKEPVNKRAPGFINLHTAIRDIEVINLDGLSEAEALKAAGIDGAAALLPQSASPSAK